MENICEFEILVHICTIKTENDLWTKEFNIVSWNGHKAKYDIREWSPDHKHMARGIALSPNEMEQIVNAYLSIAKTTSN